MPILRQIKGKPRLLPIGMEQFSTMPLSALIEYEKTLWRWADKVGSTAAIADVLNAIYREVEWRAQEKDWRDAAHPRQGP